MTDKQFVKDLKSNENIRSVFLASDKQVLKDKKGKDYMTVNLSDITGSINGRLWDGVENSDRAFQSGDLIHVKGHVQMYQNRRQVVIHEISAVTPTEYDLRDFLPAAERPAGEMFAELLKFVEEVKNPAIKNLLESTLNDPEIQPKILKCPAAKSIHHAYMGGLLEHILSICGLMKFLSVHYPVLDYDLLIYGAIYHDIGKVWELTYQQGIGYTNTGRLVGHMAIACELLDEKSRSIESMNPELRDILKHIILSHHGKLEYGSPKRPKFLEAYVVATIDEFDSRINRMSTFMKNEIEPGIDESWSRYNAGFDRYLYLDILRQRLSK